MLTGCCAPCLEPRDASNERRALVANVELSRPRRQGATGRGRTMSVADLERPDAACRSGSARAPG